METNTDTNSILISIKQLLGIDHDYTHFDTDVIIQINMAINILNQLGVGPSGFKITGTQETWDDLLLDEVNLEMSKTYIYIKTKLAFDPPLNSSVTQMYERQLTELEWRLNVEVDHK